MFYKFSNTVCAVLMLLMPSSTWAESWARTISSKEDAAEFCFQVAKDSSLDLKIKHNIDIELPLFEIEKIIEYNEKWHHQVDLYEIYEIEFPKDLNCNTLVPVWYIKTFYELQDYFNNKTKTRLSELVSHNCKVREELINGRELGGEYILEIRKYSWRLEGNSTYRFTKGFKVKIDGPCPDKKQGK